MTSQPADSVIEGTEDKTSNHAEKIVDPELTEEQIAEIESSFKLLDLNGDGKISREELQEAASLLGMNPTEEETSAMLSEADTDGDGFIEFDEYVEMMKEQYLNIDLEKERMVAAFQVIDRDNDGLITTDELTQALVINKNPKVVDDYLLKIVREADTNGDGVIDYIEFVNAKLCAKVFGNNFTTQE